MSTARTRFVLTDEERNSALWKRLLPELESRLASKRAENDDGSASMTPDQTARTRGAIETLKALIALNKPRPADEQDD